MVGCLNFFSKKTTAFNTSPHNEQWLYTTFQNMCKIPPYKIDSKETRQLKAILAAADYRQPETINIREKNTEQLGKDIAELYLVKQAIVYWKLMREHKSERADQVKAFEEIVNAQCETYMAQYAAVTYRDPTMVHTISNEAFLGTLCRLGFSKDLDKLAKYEELKKYIDTKKGEQFTRITNLKSNNKREHVRTIRTLGYLEDLGYRLLHLFRPPSKIKLPKEDSKEDLAVYDVSPKSKAYILFAPFMDFSVDCLNIICDSCNVWLDVVRVF